MGVCEELREGLAPKKINLPGEPQVAEALEGLPDFDIQEGGNNRKKTCCCANEFNIKNDQNVKAWWAMLTMLMFKLE